MPSSPSSVSAHIPTLPSNFPLLAWPPTVSKRHFCARDQQRRSRQKSRTAAKAIYRPVERLYRLEVSLYSHVLKLRISAHRTPNRAQSNPGPLRQEQAGALSFVLGQGEDGTMLFIGVPPGAAGAVTTPADILHAGHLAVGLELNHASFQRCGQIGHGV